MKLKSAVMIGSVALLLGASSALAQDAGKAAKVEELLRLTKTDQMMKQMMSQMKAMSVQQIEKSLPPEKRAAAGEQQRKLFDAISEKMSWEKFKPEVIRIYSEVYTDEELDGILAFYRSPAGQAMVAKTPQLMSRTMAYVQKMTADLQPELEKMMKESAAADKK